MNKLNSTTINVLKVLATALVFFCHSQIIAKECYDVDFSGFWRVLNTPAWGGVFIFLTISGLLACYGYETGKYTTNKPDILKYYKTRFVKILLPTYIFLSLAYIFNMQDSDVPTSAILQWLTCTFTGPGAGIKHVGASWYIFIVMWLYILSPIFFKFLERFESIFRGKEFKAYLLLIGFILVLGVVYRVTGRFCGLDWYRWLYANIIPCGDLFLIGMIGCKLIKYCPRIEEQRMIKYKRISVLLFLFMILCCCGMFRYISEIYKYVLPSFYAVFTVLIIGVYSVHSSNHHQVLGRVCNMICPYTFMFYLWHSILLGYVGSKLDFINDAYSRYVFMLIIGFLVTCYISYLFTNLNNKLIEKTQKK